MIETILLGELEKKKSVNTKPMSSLDEYFVTTSLPSGHHITDFVIVIT